MTPAEFNKKWKMRCQGVYQNGKWSISKHSEKWIVTIDHGGSKLPFDIQSNDTHSTLRAAKVEINQFEYNRDYAPLTKEDY